MGRNRRNIRGRNINIKGVSKQIVVILAVIVVVICIAILSIKIYNTNSIKLNEDTLNSEIFNANIELTEEEKAKIESEVKIDTSITITALGDVLCEKGILNSVKDTNYDFSNMFSKIKKYTSNSDIALAPIETNFVNQNYSGKGNYNSPKTLANEMKNIGIDIAFTSNNHSLDYGIEGIKETTNYLKEIGLETVGLKQEENENSIIIKEYRNMKIAFLSYTYGTNKKEDGFEKYINIINKENIQKDIESAKNQGAEYIIASMHWGNVNTSKLTKEQEELSDFLVDSGVDIIIGNHPSSLQKMETRINKNGKDVLVAYSLGNCISSENYKNSNLSMILNIELTKLAEDEKIYLNKVTYVPVYINDNGANSENRYQILDIKEEISNYENGNGNINEKTYNKLKQGLVKIKELING